MLLSACARNSVINSFSIIWPGLFFIDLNPPLHYISHHVLYVLRCIWSLFPGSCWLHQPLISFRITAASFLFFIFLGLAGPFVNLSERGSQPSAQSQFKTLSCSVRKSSTTIKVSVLYKNPDGGVASANRKGFWRPVILLLVNTTGFDLQDVCGRQTAPRQVRGHLVDQWGWSVVVRLRRSSSVPHAAASSTAVSQQPRPKAAIRLRSRAS